MKRRPDSLNNNRQGKLLQGDLIPKSSKPRTANTTQEIGFLFRCKVLDHLPDSQSLSPCNYYTYGAIKNALKGQCVICDQTSVMPFSLWLSSEKA
ncbi:hypothetical protein TNIN_455011 [Trichonephila inaurata madagascariensis]|uniref:Uncharacterized protein n=1 Tax=Trichonephila inaurata madagascariensis TaxID=2747483 RepID=A0A8X7CQZ9_9ARAC|nr:hypothetical protein TNIN_455011 [Trichonephila inaurata madagascariensis]